MFFVNNKILILVIFCLIASVLSFNLTNASKKNFKSSKFNGSVIAHQTETDIAHQTIPHWTRPRVMKKQLHAEPAGNTVVFQCKAAGPKPLNCTWYKDGIRVLKEERIGEYKFRQKNQVLVLTSVVVSDSGQFHCVVANRFGSINHTYVLDVVERVSHRPHLSFDQPVNKTAVVGSDVTFYCRIIGGRLNLKGVLWKRGPPLSGGLNNTFNKFAVIKSTKLSGGVLSSLTLKNVSQHDAGSYVCVASNYVGRTSRTSHLEVVGAPTEALNVSPPDEATNYVIFASLFGALLIASSVFCLVRSRLCRKGAPKLVSIGDARKIPHLTRFEEPLLLPGVERGWPMGGVSRLEPDLQWELNREKVVLVAALGEGFFGLVYKAHLVAGPQKQDVAVKMLKPSSDNKDVMDLLAEMDQMKRVGRHRNIVNLVGVCTQGGPLWLVTEFAEQGNLRDYLRKNRPADMQCHVTDPLIEPSRAELLSMKDLICAAYQVARGMEYLSQKKCVHRDVAARNVLVTSEFVMKIADFGLARDVHAHDYYRKNTRGHLPYKWMALEAMTDNVFTHATDVWSFGILMWEIFSLGASPYPGVKTHELVRLLRQGERLDHPQFASPELYRLMRDCWDEQPQGRPQFRQLVEDLDRMLASASSLDYIDLTSPLATGYSSHSSSESGIADEGGSSPDSAPATCDDNDSVFDKVDHVTEYLPGEDNSLLANEVTCQNVV